MHSLGVHSDRKIEATHEKFLREGLFHAQQKSWEGLARIREQMTPGISEKEAIEMASRTLKEMGSPRAWHRPNIRFGENTVKTFSERPDPERRLQENDIYFVDIGPVWKQGEFDSLEYEGDVGDTFVMGDDTQKLTCARAAKSLFDRATEYWKKTKPAGDALYRWLEAETANDGFKLLSNVDGHRIGDFPHHRFFKDGLTTLSFTPASDVWILEVQIVTLDGAYGAFFEDILA